MKNMELIKAKTVITILSKGGQGKLEKTEETGLEDHIKYTREFLIEIGAKPNKHNCSDFDEQEDVVHLDSNDFESKRVDISFPANLFKLIEKVDDIYTLYLKGGEAYELLDRHEAKKVEKKYNKICKSRK